MITLPIAGTTESYELKPTKIIAVGLNYAEHVEESGAFDERLSARPAEPVLFAKTPNTLVGHGDEIVIPQIVRESNFESPRTDLEAELAVIISKRARNIRAEDALQYVLGYSCYNDVSQRNVQLNDVSGWFRGKSFDTFGPIGPILVLAKDIPDPQVLNIAARINGEVVQSANTESMLFTVAELISYISRNMTLEAGDIVATGTPSGVSPIAVGDTVEVEIASIGVLSNPVTEEVR